MKSLAIPPRTNILCTVCLFSLLFSAIGSAQYNWQIITQPKIDYLSSIGVRSDVNQILLTGEHDGEWSNSGIDPNTLLWTFTNIGLGLIQVHGTRYLEAPAMTQNLYMSDFHGSLYYFVENPPGVRVWHNTGIGSDDGWYALAIDPNDFNPAGQKLLAGGPGVIRYGNFAPTTGVLTWYDASIGGSTDGGNTFITDIQYWRESSSIAWAATSEATGWDDVPVPGGGFTPRGCRGVLRSINAGQSWEIYPITTSPPTDPSNCVYAVAPIDSTHVYAVTKAGLWKGTFNSGPPPTMSWNEIVPPPVGGGLRISSIFYPSAVGPTQTLYVGLATGSADLDRVLKGTYDGANWTWGSTNFPPRVKVNALGGLSNNADTLYAAFANGDVFKATDSGFTTTPLQGQRAGYPMATLIIPPNQPNDNTVYVGTVCQGGVYKGVYSGTPLSWTWTNKKPAGFHKHFHYVMRLAQDPVDAGNIYVTEDDAVFKTTNGGEDWTSTLTAGGHLHGLAVAPSPRNNTLYVGSGHGQWPGGPESPGRIWRSDDSGNINSWVEVTNNFPPPPPGTCNADGGHGCYSVYTIAVSPNDPNRVFVGTFGHENYAGDIAQGRGIGVVRSTNGGGSWLLVNNGLCPDGHAANSNGAPCVDASQNPYAFGGSRG